MDSLHNGSQSGGRGDALHAAHEVVPSTRTMHLDDDEDDDDDDDDMVDDDQLHIKTEELDHDEHSDVNSRRGGRLQHLRDYAVSSGKLTDEIIADLSSSSSDSEADSDDDGADSGSAPRSGSRPRRRRRSKAVMDYIAAHLNREGLRDLETDHAGSAADDSLEFRRAYGHRGSASDFDDDKHSNDHDDDHEDNDDEDEDEENLFSPFSAVSPPFDHAKNGIEALGEDFEMQGAHQISGGRMVNEEPGQGHDVHAKNGPISSALGDNDDDDDDDDAAAQEAEIIQRAAAAAAPSLHLLSLEQGSLGDEANMRGADAGVSPRAAKRAQRDYPTAPPQNAGTSVNPSSAQIKAATSARASSFSGHSVASVSSSTSVSKGLARKRPPTVATYFVATGIDWRRALSNGPIAKLDLLDPDFCVGLPAAIKDRYPPEDYTDLPLNPQLCQFCHPIGMTIKQGRSPDPDLRRIQDYSFMMTDETHKMTHATCLAFHDPIPSKIKARLVEITLDQVLKRDRARSDWITRSFEEYLKKTPGLADEAIWFKFCQQFDSIQRELGDAADLPENQKNFNRLLDGYLEHYRSAIDSLMEEDYVASVAEIVHRRREADDLAAKAEVGNEDDADTGDASEADVERKGPTDLDPDHDDDQDSIPSLVSMEEANFFSARKKTEMDDLETAAEAVSHARSSGGSSRSGDEEDLFATPLQSPADEAATPATLDSSVAASPASPPTAAEPESALGALDDEDLTIQYCREFRLAAMQALKETFAEFSATKLGSWDPYEPKCLTLISPFPFYTLFGAILRELLRFVRDKDALPVPLERCLQHVLLEVPEPPPGKYRVRFKLHQDMPYYFTCSKPPLNRLPLLNVPLRPLFESLGGQNLLNLFSALILESSVLLVTERLDLLTNVISGLLALLWPLKWQSNVVPLLPNIPDMMELLHTPVPIIIGIHRSQIPRDPSVRNTFVFVDLDNNIVDLPTDRDMPMMSGRILRKLWDPLRALVYVNRGIDRPIEKNKRHSLGSYSTRERRNSRRRRTQRFSDTSVVSDDLGGLAVADQQQRVVTDFLEENVDKEAEAVIDKSTEVFNNTVRKIFLEFFVLIIGDYRWYMGGLEEDGDELIDRESFLRDHKDTATSRDFLNEFVSTQMMQTFFDSRVFAAEHNFEIMLFDAWIDHLGQARTTPPPSVLANAAANGDIGANGDTDGSFAAHHMNMNKHAIKASFLNDTSQSDRTNYDVEPPSAAEYEGAGLFKMNSRAFPATLHWNALPLPRAVPSLMRARRGSHLLRNVDKVSHVLESVNLSFFTKQRLFRARFTLVKRYARAGLRDVRELSQVVDGIILHLEDYASTMDKALREVDGKPRTRVLNPAFEPNPFMRGSVWAGLQQEAEQQVKLCQGMANELTEHLSVQLKEVIRALSNMYNILVESEEKHMRTITDLKAAMENSKMRKFSAKNDYNAIEAKFAKMQAQMQRQTLEDKLAQQASAMSRYYRSATPSTRKRRRRKRRSGVGDPLDVAVDGASPGTPGRRESNTSGQTPASVGSGDVSQAGAILGGGMEDAYDLASPRSVQSRFGTLGSPRSEQSLRTAPRSEGSIYSAASAGDLFGPHWCEEEGVDNVDDGDYSGEEDGQLSQGDAEHSHSRRPSAVRIGGSEGQFPKELAGGGEPNSAGFGIFTDDVSLNVAMSESYISRSVKGVSGRSAGRRASATFLSSKLKAGSQRHRRRSEALGLASMAASAVPVEPLRILAHSLSSRDDLDKEDAATDSSESRGAADRAWAGPTTLSPSSTTPRRAPESAPRVAHVSSAELSRVLDRKIAAKRNLRAARLQFAQDVASLTRELTNFTEANSHNLQMFHRNERTRIKNVKTLLKQLMTILFQNLVGRRQATFESLHAALLSPIWRTPIPSRAAVTDKPRVAEGDASSKEADAASADNAGGEAKEPGAAHETTSKVNEEVKDETNDQDGDLAQSRAGRWASPHSSNRSSWGSRSSQESASGAAPLASATVPGILDACDLVYPFPESLPSMNTRPHGGDADREDVFTEWRDWMNGVAALYKTGYDSGSYRVIAMRDLAQKFHDTVESMEVGRGFNRKNSKPSTLQKALLRVKECLVIIASTMSNNAVLMDSAIVRMSDEMRKAVLDSSTELGNAHEELLERIRAASQNAQKADQLLAAKAADKEKVLQDLARAAQEARELQEQVVGSQEVGAASTVSSSSTGSGGDVSPSSGAGPGAAAAGGSEGAQARALGDAAAGPERRSSDDHSVSQQRGGLRSAVKRVLKSSDVDRLAHALKKQERLAKKLQDLAEEETVLTRDRDQKHEALKRISDEYRLWMEEAFAKFRAVEVDRVATSVRQLHVFVEGIRAEREVIKVAIKDRKEAVRSVDPQEDLRKHKDLDERTKRYLDDALDHLSRHPSMAGMVSTGAADGGMQAQAVMRDAQGLQAGRSRDADENTNDEDENADETDVSKSRDTAVAGDGGDRRGGRDRTGAKGGDAYTSKSSQLSNGVVTLADGNGPRRSGRFDSVDSMSLERGPFAMHMRKSLGTVVLRFRDIKDRLKSLQKHSDVLAKAQRRATQDLNKLCAHLGVVPLNILEQRREVDPFDDLFLKTFMSVNEEMSELTKLDAALSNLSIDARASKRDLRDELLVYINSLDVAESRLALAHARFDSTRQHLQQMEAEKKDYEASVNGFTYRSRIEERRKDEKLSKLFGYRSRCEQAEKAHEEAKAYYDGEREVYELCFTQLLDQMQNGYTEALSSCMRYLQTFVESVQAVSLEHAKTSPFMNRKSRALETTEEPIVFEGDNDAVLDLAAMDTNGFFDPSVRVSREGDSMGQSYASGSTADDSRNLLADAAPLRSLSGSRHDRSMRESILTLGGATSMASNLKQQLGTTSAVAQLSKMFASSRHAFLNRPVGEDASDRRERPVRCDEVETVILHSKLICESLLEILPERQSVIRAVLTSAQEQVSAHPILGLSERSLHKKRKLLAKSQSGAQLVMNGVLESDIADLGEDGILSVGDTGSPRSALSGERMERGMSGRSGSTVGTARLEHLLRPGRSVRQLGHRIRRFVPRQGSSMHRTSERKTTDQVVSEARGRAREGLGKDGASSSTPKPKAAPTQGRRESSGTASTVTELDAVTFGLGGSSALNSILGAKGNSAGGGSTGQILEDEATSDGTESVATSATGARRETSTLFAAITKVHRSWGMQVESALKCAEASDSSMTQALREMVDFCGSCLKEIHEIRTNLRRSGLTVRNAVARANEKVEEARMALRECEKKDYHRNLLTQEAGMDRKQRKVGAAKRKLQEAEDNKLAADDKLVDYQRFYRNEAARVMRIYDRMERHQFSFLISLHDQLQFWHKRLAAKLDELTTVSRKALASVDLQADVQSFVDANKIASAISVPIKFDAH